MSSHLREKTVAVSRWRFAEGQGGRARAAGGKLLPRERIDALIDPGRTFARILRAGGLGDASGDVASASIVGPGVGRVQGVDA